MDTSLSGIITHPWHPSLEAYHDVPALSVRQPWAWLIVQGFKGIENRVWKYNPRHVGNLYIHASKGCTRSEHEEAVSVVHRINPDIRIPSLKDLEKGGLVGMVHMDGFTRQSLSPWFFGPLGLVLSDPRHFPFIACKGQLGFFNARQNLIT